MKDAIYRREKMLFNGEWRRCMEPLHRSWCSVRQGGLRARPEKQYDKSKIILQLPVQSFSGQKSMIDDFRPLVPSRAVSTGIMSEVRMSYAAMRVGGQ